MYGALIDINSIESDGWSCVDFAESRDMEGLLPLVVGAGGVSMKNKNEKNEKNEKNPKNETKVAASGSTDADGEDKDTDTIDAETDAETETEKFQESIVLDASVMDGSGVYSEGTQFI